MNLGPHIISHRAICCPTAFTALYSIMTHLQLDLAPGPRHRPRPRPRPYKRYSPFLVPDFLFSAYSSFLWFSILHFFLFTITITTLSLPPSFSRPHWIRSH